MRAPFPRSAAPIPCSTFSSSTRRATASTSRPAWCSSPARPASRRGSWRATASVSGHPSGTTSSANATRTRGSRLGCPARAGRRAIPRPTPTFPQNREHQSGYLASLSDGLRVAYDDVDDWLQHRTLEQTAVAWVVGFGVLVWIIARGVRRRGAPGSGAGDDEAALPCLEVLLATLARAGVGHDGREPIERLAARAPDRDAARLLERYAALRYGGVGDPAALADDVAAYAKRLTPGPWPG